MITDKITPVERALIAAASMPSPQARHILMLLCQAGMTTDKPVEQSKISEEGAAHYEKRRKFINRFKTTIDRHLDYARHETLRNCERYFGDALSSMYAAEGKTNTLAARLTFDKSALSEDLLDALKEEQTAALLAAGQGLFDEVGRDDPFRLTDKQAIAFIKKRANLLANVPDEIHATIMETIQDGLEHGEGRRELMQRISTAFDEIGRGRAEAIANTETSAAFNFARAKAMKKAGVTHKKWLLSQSPLIKEHRETHVNADGQVQPINDPFDVGGVKFMQPGDDALGAGPEDIINCHCVAIAVEKP
jgi:uncharacterized protein with gpF-like domain